MRLIKLKLKNFQSWRDCDLSFDTPATLVLGKNNSGKTSLARAIEVLLRGATQLNKPGYKGKLQDMITDGEKMATVDGLVVRTGLKLVTDALPNEVTVSIARNITAKGTETAVNGHPANRAVADFFCPVGLLDPDAVLSVVCNVSGFFALDEKKARAILESLVDQSVPNEMFTGLPDMQAYLPGQPKTLDDLESAYDAVYAKRTQANAQFSGLKPIKKPIIPKPDDALVTKIETKLDELRGQRAQELRSEGERSSKLRFQRQRESEIKQAIAMTEAKLPSAGLSALAGRIKECKRALANAEQVQEQRDKLTAFRATFSKNITSMTGLGATCVISDDVPCPLDNAARKRFVDLWSSEMQKIDIANSKLPEAAVRVHQAALDEVVRQHRLREITEPELKTLRQQLATVSGELQEAEKLVGEPTVSPNPLDVRIGNGSAKLEEAHTLRREWVDWTTHEVDSKRLGTATTELDALCKALGPGGIREKLLVSRLSVLLDKLNGVLKGFGIVLALSDGQQWNPRLNGRAVATASESELYRAGIALQIAIAELSGLRFVVIDRADLLDGDNRKALFDAVKIGLDAGYIEQAILLATMSNEKALKAERPEWLGLLHVTTTDVGSQAV